MVQIIKEDDGSFSYYAYKGEEEIEENLIIQGFDFETQEELITYFEDLKNSLGKINKVEE